MEDQVAGKSSVLSAQASSSNASISPCRPMRLLPLGREEAAMDNEGLRSIFSRDYGLNRTKEIWSHIRQKRKPPTFPLLIAQISDREQLDLHVVAKNGVTFHCHSLVCRAYSGFFRNSNGADTVQLPDEVSSLAFMMLYDWMLEDDPTLDMDSILELYKAATVLDVKALQQHCYVCLDNTEEIRENSAFEIFLKACNSDVPVIAGLMVTRISKYFLSLVASNDYLKFKVDDIKLLLNSNAIGVNTEVETFFAAVRWLNHAFDQRKGFIKEVMSCVRFDLLPPWYLLTLDREELPAEVERVVRNESVRKIIVLALSYLVMKRQCKYDNAEFEAYLKSINSPKPQPRHWIFDRNCSYHLNIGHHAKDYPSYDLFISYLIGLRSVGATYWENLEYVAGDHLRYLCCLKRNTKDPNAPALQFNKELEARLIG